MPQSTLQPEQLHPGRPIKGHQDLIMHSYRLAPLQIAQAGEGAPTATAGGGETHTSTKEAPNYGEIPDPILLFENSIFVALLMVVFALIVRRRLERVPRTSQNIAEYLVEALNNFTINAIGPGGEKYTPLVGTVFLYILLMNLIGIIPGFHSPTTNITVTLALGVVVFVYSQWEGLRKNGLGHLGHFLGPKLGKYPVMAPLMLPVEFISEFVRPFTLAVRLFGNIFGEDVIIVVLAALGGMLGGSALGWIPIQFPVLLLSLLTDVVQALVFAILTCIYISLAIHHDDEGHGHEEAHTASPEAAHALPAHH